jgi:hypothetical protein
MAANPKQQAHELVERLGDEDLDEAVDFMLWLLTESETLTDDELAAVQRGEAEIDAGEYTTLDALRRSLGR